MEPLKHSQAHARPIWLRLTLEQLENPPVLDQPNGKPG